MARAKDLQLDQRIGYRIGRERERRGLTAMVLASRAGIHVNTVYSVEQGRGISVGALFKIAAALGVKVDALGETYKVM